ncbi:gamma-glutamyltranspeptidase [Polynucleobacter sp. SHI8]|uniref:gamma-glutamyltransferase n=1 Tax=unclassified Polynucleobacter TaxID=2640945 RepID=UPI002490DEC6|nr:MULTISPECIES: gamma-glutamyltransferase [unclassified Polynucleobacter]BDW12044.1 gamma-glutamyltranspeptidase [Polynucleobacter sp. SHI2]BDW14492.1 gamma-glutamyltranspeptidase [Polynucleobacter sp. SHI8]
MNKGFQLFTLIGLTLYYLNPLAQSITELSPEPSSQFTNKRMVFARQQMVVSANPYISEAGNMILEQGGNAVDAAIATALMVTLVEPQSGGIGGGGFILYFNPKESILTSIDARETSSNTTKENQFLDNNDKPLNYGQAVFLGTSVGVPSLLKGLEQLHKKYGNLEWKKLFLPAIQLAKEGFIISPRLHTLIVKDPFLLKNTNASRYFFDKDLNPLPIGYLLKNPELAKVLEEVSIYGVEKFYEGEIARDTIQAVKNHPTPGGLNEDDLKQYQAVERKVVCGPYRTWKICGMGPPSSGGTTLISMLGILQNFPLSELKEVDYLHYLSEAGRLAYADRDTYIADPDFIDIPIDSLIDSKYTKERSHLISIKKSMTKAKPGNFNQSLLQLGSDSNSELPATSHISIVDKNGQAVTMTISVASAFGSRIMTNGFFLNNEMTDFSFMAKDNQQLIANRLAPTKRPRSSMSPTFVFDEQQRLVMAIGSAGGPSIINYVAKTITGVLDRNLNIQEAIDYSNIGSRNQETELEKDSAVEKFAQELQLRGHPILIREMNSGTQGIFINRDGLWGGVDGRREGVAKGY